MVIQLHKVKHIKHTLVASLVHQFNRVRYLILCHIIPPHTLKRGTSMIEPHHHQHRASKNPPTNRVSVSTVSKQAAEAAAVDPTQPPSLGKDTSLRALSTNR